MSKSEQTSLVIIGAGAAGLMAACRAGELGVPALLLERKHRVGSKLLMCGNGRCNLSTSIPADMMLADFGPELAPFLGKALRQFSPSAQQKWFEQHRLPLIRTAEGRIFPKSERAPDVVHCFTDTLRDLSIALCLNAAVQSVRAVAGGFAVTAGAFSITAGRVLVATGGVSYPKTGSVGDGQRFARELGHRVRPYRPGLVGVEHNNDWWREHRDETFHDARVCVFDGDRLLGETTGPLICERWGMGGGAISNATRLLSRAEARKPQLEVTPSAGVPSFRIADVKMRSLKEAMVTVGGVDLEDVDPDTMESRRLPGLYFAGEVLDVDGPTGGYNLTAAFATARLAVNSIAASMGLDTPRRNARPAGTRRRGKRGRM